ncbi:MAG: hypothetical protein H6807_08125 [Planctomycetes bacterium]|nr:hypothetical protein [Planctomycetota bacterium]
MSHQHLETRLGEILVTESFGNLILVGPDRHDLLPALGACCSEFLLIGDEDADEVAEALAEMGAEVGIVAVDEDEGDDRMACGLILARLPDEPLAESVDRLVGRVADHGFVLCDLPPLPRSDRLRLERLLRSLLTDIVVLDDAETEGGLVLHGRRKARGVDQVVMVEGSPLSLTVFVYSQVADEALNQLVIDILFRQNVPPALMIVLDDAIRDEDRVPDDLWGLAGHSVTQPAILRSGGVGRSAALVEGLDQLETDYFAILEAGDRPSALWAERLTGFLDLEEDCGAVVAGAISRGESGELRERALGCDPGPGLLLPILLSGEAPARAVLVFRSAALTRELPGGLDEALPWHLLLQVAAKGPIGNLPLPLAVCVDRPLAGADAARALELLARDLDPKRIEEGLTMVPAEDRPGLARHVLAGALHQAGLWDLALPIYRDAISLEPDLVELRVDHLRALRWSGRAEEFLAVAREVSAAAHEEGRYRLALAAARCDLGDFSGVDALLGPVEDEVDEELGPSLHLAAALARALERDDRTQVDHLIALGAYLVEDGRIDDLLDLMPGLGPGPRLSGA